MEQIIRFDDGASTTLESWGDRGPAVVCVHGITSSRKSWERTARALADAFRVFAYDQRGHGDSAAVDGPMTLQRSLQDLTAVAATIGEPLALIGHSWGGAVAMLGGKEAFATKVVAIDPMIRVEPGSWRREYLEDAEHELGLEWSRRRHAIEHRLRDWDPIDVAGKLHAVRSMKASAIALLGSENRVDDGGWDLRNIVAEYPKPLLVMAAAPGESTLSETDIELLVRDGGRNVEVTLFEDQGHNLHRTAFERYIGKARPFLELG